MNSGTHIQQSGQVRRPRLLLFHATVPCNQYNLFPCGRMGLDSLGSPLIRWAEHFNSVPNRPSSVNDNAINRLPQIECNVVLDEFPTVTETRKAIQHLSSGKAPGTDAIPAEVYKAGGLPMAEKLTELFQCMWRKEAIPQDFKDASIIHLYKRRGNPQVCDNHRGISLLSIAGNILAKFF